jgi:hypothetical protein
MTTSFNSGTVADVVEGHRFHGATAANTPRNDANHGAAAPERCR